MAENEVKGNVTHYRECWSGWICGDCAAKLGWKLPNGFVADAGVGNCPRCGKRGYLVPEEDYRVHGVPGKKA